MGGWDGQCGVSRSNGCKLQTALINGKHGTEEEEGTFLNEPEQELGVGTLK